MDKKLIVFCCAFSCAAISQSSLAQQPSHAPQPSAAPLYKDSSLPLEQRVGDLVSRMTLEEKVSQFTHVADPTPRLGIPGYNWWNEGLHGVARAGAATGFPQA